MPPEFERWCAVVSTRLEDYTGRGLADAPVWMLRGLVEWHARGWAAVEVAERLAECRWPARVTVSRFYTDRRPAELRAQLRGNYGREIRNALRDRGDGSCHHRGQSN